MSNTREVLTVRCIVDADDGTVQAAIGTPVANGDLNVRDKWTITREEIVTRREYRDCRDEDMIAAKIDSRMARYTLDYGEVTPQIIARWTALFLGTAASPTGTPANEVQTIADGGTAGTIAL